MWIEGVIPIWVIARKKKLNGVQGFFQNGHKQNKKALTYYGSGESFYSGFIINNSD